VLPAGWRGVVERGFEDAVVWASVICFSAHKNGILQALAGLPDASWWSEHAGFIEPDSTRIAQVLSGRGISAREVQTLVDDARHIRAKVTALPGNGFAICRWGAHGHLGAELIWSALEFDLSASQQIDGLASLPRTALTDDAYRFFASLWAQRIRDGTVEAPRALFEWIARATTRQS
jgi:hypothetical protein